MAFELPASDHRVPLGKAAVQREGSDVTVVSYARMAVQARAAAAQATAEGISVAVVDLRTIAPWDRQTVLASPPHSGRVIVVPSAVHDHGAGAEIAAVPNGERFSGLPSPTKAPGGEARR